MNASFVAGDASFITSSSPLSEKNPSLSESDSEAVLAMNRMKETRS